MDVGKVTGTIWFKDEASKSLKGFINNLKKTEIGWKTAAAGATVLIGALAYAKNAFDTQILAINSLNTALANQGKFSEAASKQIQDMASAQQKLTIYGDEVTIQAATAAAAFGVSGDKITELIPLVQDYASATGKDLKAAFLDVGKATNGQVSMLSRYGIKTNEAMSETERFQTVVKGLGNMFEGQAALKAQTLVGRLTQLKNSFGDTMEQIGKFVTYMTGTFGGTVEGSIGILEKLGDFFGKTLPTVVSEAKAQFALMLASLLDMAAGISEFLGKVPGFSKILPDPGLLRDIAKGQRDLAEEVRKEADEFVKSSGAAEVHNKEIGEELPNAIDKASKKVSEFQRMMDEWRKENQLAAEEQKVLNSAIEQAFDFPVPPFDPTKLGLGDGPGSLQAVQQEILDQIESGIVKGVGDVQYATEQVIKRQEDYNKALQQAANIAQAIPGILGQILSSTISAVGALKSLTSGPGGFLGGLKEAFSTGTGGKGGILGMLGGIGGLAGALGPLVNAGMAMGKAIFSGIKKLFSIGGPNIARDVARDIGPQISEQLEKAIKESGRPAQLAIAEIFQEGFANGTATVDKFAEEIGDLFSYFERGEISKPELISALEESIPMLMDRLEELGPAGEEQLQRIISAAQAMGIEFEGLSELIQGTFAPDTMEEIAEAFNMTNDQVRELAKELGINVQTNLERMASSVGLSVDEFKKLGEAVKEKYGIPMEDIGKLLESMGVSAEELAAALGVEVSDSTDDLQDGLNKNADEMTRGATEAERMAAQLERAARASHDIDVPNMPSYPGAQHGEIADRPMVRMIGEAGPEVVAPVRALFGSLGDDIAGKVASAVRSGGGGRGGGGGNEIHIHLENSIAPDASRLARVIGPAVGVALRENYGQAATNAREGLDRG